MPRKQKAKNLRWQKLNAAVFTIRHFLFEKLLELGEIFPQPLEAPYAYRRRLEGWPKEYPIHRVRQEIKRMKDRGWIEESERQGKKFLKLTKKGKLQVFYRKLQDIDQLSQKVWDGKWRLAIFDIPEKGRRERDIIRGILKTVGFYQLQKSVYVYPFEIPGEVTTYLRESGLLVFIRFARVDRMDDVGDLMRYFKI